MKAKVELTAELVKSVIDGKKPSSMTQLAHLLGYKGSVSSSLTKKFRALVPDVEGRMAANKANKADAKPKAAKAKGTAKPGKAAKPTPAIKEGRWPRDPRNPFRQGSAYATCFDILAAHKSGLAREKLVELLAEATGKDARRAGYDAQVLLSAKPNQDGLSNDDSPRHRSCRPGFWIQRTNGHVKLMFG